MADDRTYIKVHDGMPGHPKVRGLSDKAFRTFVSALCYCSEYLTDGQVVAAAAKFLGPPKSWQELVDDGLAEPAASGYLMHDYLEHQRSAQQIQELKDKRRAAGRLGGRPKGAASKPKASANQVLEQVPKQNESKNNPETESLTNVRDQAETEPSLRSGSAHKRATSAPDDLKITDTMRQWAAEKTASVQIERETEKFLDHHRAKGSTFKDWTAAWRTWMSRAEQYTATVRPIRSSPTAALPATHRADGQTPHWNL